MFDRAMKSKCDATKILQRWEGYVVSIGPNSFRVVLTDRTNNGMQDGEEAVIPLWKLDAETRKSLVPNRVFNWRIGYDHTDKGQRKRFTRITFNRAR